MRKQVKHALGIGGLVVGGLLTLLFLCNMAGCDQIPDNMVGIDENADGINDAVAWDLDNDNIPDLDETGKIKLVWGSLILPVAQSLDETGPDFLDTIAPIIPGFGGVLVAVGALWRKYKWNHRFMNLVFAIQSGRQRIVDSATAEGKVAATLSILDSALGSVDQGTLDAVKDIKDAFNQHLVGEKATE